jgi:CRP-like cAMP-binding protein
LGFFDYALTKLAEQAMEIFDLKLRTAIQRLAQFLLEQIKNPEIQPARFALPYDKRYLAAKIGCAQEHLSRAFPYFEQSVL